MPLERILEPEVMDSQEEATDYDSMDHREVNRRFVDDFIVAIRTSVLSTEYSVLSTQPPRDDRSPASADNPKSQIGAPASAGHPKFLDILDLGTGTALIPIELCQKFADCRVMAADAAVSMLDLARYNLEVNSLTHRIELAHVDAKLLPFGNAMFDVVMSNSIIHHIPEPIHVLREAIRVTKPGGLLFIRDLLRPDTLDELNHLVATYTPGANDHQQLMFAESLHAALSLTEIHDLIASLGFSHDSIQQTSDRHWTWSAQNSSALRRQQIIGHLQLLASDDLQLAYERDVPRVDITAELICIWFNDLHHPKWADSDPNFSTAELAALAEFHRFFDVRVDRLPPSRGTVRTWLSNPTWREIMHEADRLLAGLGPVAFTRKE
jgi:ubiquinone/menaquinone biosynthesis C-methylase UbiE